MSISAFVPEGYFSPRLLLPAVGSLLLSAAFALPAPAQQVLVQNGATIEVNNGGTLDLQGATMDFGDADGAARLKEISAGRVTGGLLTAARALNNPSSADPAGLGAVLSASADLGEVTVTRGHTVQTGGGNESIERYYDISPSKNNSGLSATLTQTYADAELNGLSESDLVMFKSADGGSNWDEKGTDSRDASANTVTLGGISSFSRWTLGSSTSPLPVEMASFEASRAGRGAEQTVRLRWQTASEQGNAGFAIQRRAKDSSPGSTWKKVGFRESKAEGGTTSEAHTYRFVDQDLPYAADTLEYRLRQVDTDGTGHLTDPIAVARGGPARLQLKKTYPNPASGRVTVRFAVPEQATEGEARLQLYDVLGREVRTAPAKVGRHETRLSVEGLSSGVYMLRLEAGTQARTRRLTVVK